MEAVVNESEVLEELVPEVLDEDAVEKMPPKTDVYTRENLGCRLIRQDATGYRKVLSVCKFSTK